MLKECLKRVSLVSFRGITTFELLLLRKDLLFVVPRFDLLVVVEVIHELIPVDEHLVVVLLVISLVLLNFNQNLVESEDGRGVRLLHSLRVDEIDHPGVGAESEDKLRPLDDSFL